MPGAFGTSSCFADSFGNAKSQARFLCRGQGPSRAATVQAGVTALRPGERARSCEQIPIQSTPANLLSRTSIVSIYLVDGTCELFRHHYAVPSGEDSDGNELATLRGVLARLPGMIRSGATYCRAVILII